MDHEIHIEYGKLPWLFEVETKKHEISLTKGAHATEAAAVDVDSRREGEAITRLETTAATSAATFDIFTVRSSLAAAHV